MNNYPKKKQNKKNLHKHVYSLLKLFLLLFYSKRFAKTEAVLDLPHVLEGVSPV